MKDFYSYLDKNKIYLTKHLDECTKKITTMNVAEMIDRVIEFDESKMLFSSKNYLPRNMSKIYQPIDRTNQITMYDFETEKFKKFALFPKRNVGFTFLPFSRYLNFNGRLFVSGGYEDSKLSRTFWAIEDLNNFTENNDLLNDLDKNDKFQNLSNVYNQFYLNINDKNFIFEDENYSNMRVIRCSSMINSRAGHSMFGLSPSLIMAFGGTENNRTCEVYHFESNRWEEIASMNCPRIDPSVFIYKNYIYLFFGLQYDKLTKKYQFLDTIERISLLNTQTSEWEYLTPKFSESMNKSKLPRSLAGITVKGGDQYGSSIYICGGQVEKEKYSSDVFEYNLELNTLSPSEKKLPKPSAFIEQNFIYLFKTGINFDIYGDVFYYYWNDTFNFQFQKLKD
jgi:hypothetical protein